MKRNLRLILTESSTHEFNSEWPVPVMSADEVVSKVSSLRPATFFSITQVRKRAVLAAFDPNKKDIYLKSGKQKYGDTPSVEVFSVVTYQGRTGIIYSDKVKAVLAAHEAGMGRRAVEDDPRGQDIATWVVPGRLGVNYKGTSLVTLFLRQGSTPIIGSKYYVRIDNGDMQECSYEDIAQYLPARSHSAIDTGYRTFGYASPAAAISDIHSEGQMSKQEIINYAKLDNPSVADVINDDTIDAINAAEAGKINAATLSNELSDSDLDPSNDIDSKSIVSDNDPESADFDEEQVVEEAFFRGMKNNKRITESLSYFKRLRNNQR